MDTFEPVPHRSPPGIKESTAFALARAAIALAWADGELHPEEVACLEDFLYQMPALSPGSLAEIKRLLRSPVSAEERDAAVAGFSSLLCDPEIRAFALDALAQLIAADGRVTPAEECIMDSIDAAIARGDSGPDSDMALHSLLADHLPCGSDSEPRRKDVARFIDHNVGTLAARYELLAASWRVSPGDRERAGLFGALIARLPLGDIDDEPLRGVITRSLRTRLGLDTPLAGFAAIAATTPGAAHLDLSRVARLLYELTDACQRREFIHVLIDVVDEVGEPGFEPLDEVMNVAANLRVGQDEFSAILERIESSWGSAVSAGTGT
ncbi:MAG: TerB family tellurite resistance protein [Opitutales bacterium]|nr:TerB family tellurite resistance protein [Opitutales bacterium]